MKYRLTLRSSLPHPGHPAEQSFVLGEGERCVVGRGPTAQVNCEPGACSREHCVFEVTGGALLLSDLRSTGGTFLNRKRITSPTPVLTGAVIFVGRVQLDVLALETIG